MKKQADAAARIEAKLEKIEKTLASLQKALEHLEKRNLLRLRGAQYCRICGPDDKRRKPKDPPISKLEKIFCKANHGLGGKKKARLPLDWEEVERLAR